MLALASVLHGNCELLHWSEFLSPCHGQSFGPVALRSVSVPHVLSTATAIPLVLAMSRLV